jgi:PKD repeat protein
VDVENGFVFAATGKGLMMWKEALETGDPNVDTAPVLMDQVYAPSVVPDWHQSDLKFYLHGIDAPDGDATVVAVASVFNNGMLIWKVDDSSGKKEITLKYQDSEKSGSQVWATKIGGVSYAFYAATSSKVLVYNLDEAKKVNGVCLDVSPITNTCPGVYKGMINTQTAASYIGGTGNFLAVSQSFLGVEIWNVANPAQPQKVLQAAPPGGTRGVALWKDGNNYYLAAVGTTAPALRIYNVTCITSGSCPSSFGSPLGSFDVNLSSIFVTASKKNSTVPFLYVGGEDQFSGGAQREYVLDVSNPAAPNDVTPHVNPDGYWGWYYYGNSTGFNWVMPRSAKFQGNFLYRAAYGLMDVHKHTGGGPPVANFAWNDPVYLGDPVTFTDTSTGGPTSWSWTFSGGQPAAFADKTPPGVVFSAPAGDRQVTLDITKNGAQPSSKTQTVKVIDPVPQIASVSVSPATPVVCQPITFKAEGVTGKPQLTYAWTLDSAAPPTGAPANGNTLVWTPTQDQAGSHSAAVTVSNGQGQGSDSAPVTVAALQPLNPVFTPTNDAFTAGKVQFHANQPGSVVWWSWDFDDDANPSLVTWTAWTNDPNDQDKGPNASHTYTTKGIRAVKVRVSQNCTTPDDVTAAPSLPLAVDIQNPIALKAQFTAQCPLGFCAFSIGESIPFVDASTGAESYDYSWDGDTNFEDVNHTTPVLAHVYTAQGDYQPKLKIRRGSGESDVYTLAQVLKVRPGGGGGGGGNNPSISISGPSTGNVGASLSYTASASNCTPSTKGWNWNPGGGTLTGSGNSVTISWASAGPKSISVTNTECANTTGSKTVTINNDQPAVLKAAFTYSPVGAKEGQAVSFNGTLSTGSPTSYAWTFGDGGTAAGSTATHTYATAGSYVVTLSVTKPGSGCAPAPFCESTAQQTVAILSNGPVAAFASPSCVSELGILLCSAKAGDVVTLTDASTGTVTSRTWDFGDGSATANGATVTHVFKHSGSFPVTLTVSDGTRTSTFSKNFGVTGETTVSIVLPWIAQSRGVLTQSSDLYVHNPGTNPMEIVLEFRKQGLPEVAPPQVTRTIQPGATLYVGDVIKELFNRENIVGFVTLTRTQGDAYPVMTSFNTTFGGDGSQFGQTIPGVNLNREAAAPSTTGRRVQYLVGLNDNSDREAYFGITNPNAQPATYRLKFFDSLGRPIGTPSVDLKLSSFGLKQFQPAEIRSKFGLNTQDDYRVEVETVSGDQLYPYGANVRTTSDDPSFLGVGLSNRSKLYLIGALSTPGLNKTIWQTDIVLANTDTQVALTDVTFLRAGLTSQPTTPVHVTLQPGETQRLADVVAAKWNIRDAVGVITLESDSPNGVFPIVQGESYDTSSPNPGMRFGQFMAAFTDEDAAGTGQGSYLAGLRQDANSRTTYWLFNPSNQPGRYDLIYRALDGTELGRIADATLAAGKLRQISPSQHPLPAAGAPGGGFTLQVVVHSGKVIAAGQVVNNKTNDPAYVQGQTQ